VTPRGDVYTAAARDAAVENHEKVEKIWTIVCDDFVAVLNEFE